MAPHKDSSTIFAVKIISKNKVLQSQQQEHLFNEIKYMAKLNSPMVCMMRGVAQDSRNLYILMDYLQHGELLNVLKA
jgi:protein kinase A